jgi:hypothetical protein
MYKYVKDKEYLALLRRTCGSMMQELCHILKEDYDIGAVPKLIGSGSRKLITQNGNNPVDLDYNLEIVKCKVYGNCRSIKEAVRKSFNKVLRDRNWNDCSDSTSSLGTETRYFTDYPNKPSFSIDVGIVCRNSKGSYYRLIHEKTGRVSEDGYYWNEAPNSHKVRKKFEFIIQKGKWTMISDEYLRLKNMYLRQNDHNHPSFICYIEAVNNVYNKLQNRR